MLIEDLAFNALLIVANHALEEIAADLGQDAPGALLTRFRSAEGALETLWDEATGQYFSRDAVTGALIKLPTIATFLPLWSRTLPASCVAQLVQRLRDPSQYWPAYPSPERAARRGAVRRAALLEGADLAEHQLDHHRRARRARRNRARRVAPGQSLALVDAAGCYEYFSPVTGQGHGASDFSWTAALAIDMLASTE